MNGVEDDDEDDCDGMLSVSVAFRRLEHSRRCRDAATTANASKRGRNRNVAGQLPIKLLIDNDVTV